MPASDHRAFPWFGAMGRRAVDRRAPERPGISGAPGESWWRAYRAPLLLAAIAAGAIALIWLASGPVLDAAARALEGASDHDTALGRAGATTVLVAAVLLAFVVRWGSLSSPRRPLQIPGGVRLPVDALAALLRAELTAIDAVVVASVRVANRHRRGVSVEVFVEVGPEALLSQVGAEARELAVAAVERRLGLRLATPPRVQLRYSELRLSQRLSPAPEGCAARRWERGSGRALKTEGEDRDARGGGPGVAAAPAAGEGAVEGRGRRG